MLNSAIWVIVANDNDAAICASSNGTSRLLRTVSRAPGESVAHGLALRVVAEMLHGARHEHCDGVILIAKPSFLEEMEQVAIPQVRNLVIANIVGSPPQGFFARPGLESPAIQAMEG